MKFSSTLFLTLLNSYLVSCQPVPEIHTVFVTHYTTVQSTVINGGEATNAISGDAQATPTASSYDSTQTQDSNKAEDTKEIATTAYNKAQTTSQVTATDGTTSDVSPATGTSTGSSSTETSEPSSGDHSGQGTYYSTGLGACGKTNQDTDYIVAVSHILYENNQVNGNSNDNALCGKKIKASYEGKSVEVTVVDSCEGCAENDLDFSPSAFSEIADKSLGRIDITWEWIS